MRLLDDTTLPAYKGAMLRGGFGYAFQRASCPQGCWGAAKQCAVGTLCPYHWVFETPHPPQIPHLHDLQDVPRPFVIDPPSDDRTSYTAGETLEFGLVLIGRGIDYLPYFIYGFEQLGKMGLGRRHTQARLERVEALRPWEAIGQVVYRDGRVDQGSGVGGRGSGDGETRRQGDGAYQDDRELPIYDASCIAARTAELPSDLRIVLRTPLRVKSGGEFLRRFDLPALVQSACWRLNALAVFHGSGPWQVDHRALIAQARAVGVEQTQIRWEDWRRTSTRGGEPQMMPLGGIVGSAILRGVPADIRAVLLAGSIVHVGKAAVFGHGGFDVRNV
jgi:hypothetical protein